MTMDGFEAFVGEVRPRLARALLATFGLERGGEALAESMAYAWEHFDDLELMDNPGGYLYRVGASRSRRRRRDAVDFPEPQSLGLPSVEPKLASGLRRLSERQRVCVVLVHGFGWTHRETAEFLGLSRSSVQNHVERGLESLRQTIGAYDDA
jgi:DNA-directed RNA polymerase specialized sigma24 family protein